MRRKKDLFDIIATHRIAASRVFGFAFFVVVLITDSANEGTLVSSLLFLLGLVLVGVATIGRLWCSLYISGYKNTELITAGPYSITRNPLYLCSIVGFAGIGFATETVTLGVALVVLALIFYPSVIAREEEYLLTRYAEKFSAYCAKVPRLIPRFAGFTEPGQYLVNPMLFRRTMGDVIWFVVFVGIIEFVEAIHEYAIFPALISLP